MGKPKKILFAASDVGYRMELYKKFIANNLKDKLQAETLVIDEVSREHYKTDYDYKYNFFGKSFLYRWTWALLNFFRSIFRYDIFHFISGETLLTRKLRRSELMTYKLFGKKIVMHFVGADIRSEAYSQWKEINLFQFLQGKDDFPKSEPWQRKLIKDAEQFADYILVSTPDLLELIPSAHFYPVLLDLSKFQSELDKFEAPQKKPGEIVILHCPTNAAKNMKGTVHIDVVLEKIVAQSKHNIRLIRPYKDKEGTTYTYTASRYELFKLYKEADIVIDQMVTGWYGLLSVEALAAGKEVICYVDKKLQRYLFPGCPIHLADINELEQTLNSCIEKLASGNSTDAARQLDWVKKYHSIWENNSELLRAWNVQSQ
jgi:hypothetical protein